nr:metallophosphoesterase family protein [Candidatus Sigynarchaeum springense]
MKLDFSWKGQGPARYQRWGPYLSFDGPASTCMRVTWQSKFYSTERWIAFGKTRDCASKKEQSIVDAPSRAHSFLLDGLEPSTTYYYRISRPEDLAAPDPPVYSFTTGPPDGTRAPFDFCVAGDMHARDMNVRKLLNSMEKNVPASRFLVSCGDPVYHGGVDEAWNELFYQIDPWCTRVPFMNATGNHDTDHPETYARFLDTFRHPYHDRANGAYYSFQYGNVACIVLDSTNAGQAAATQGVVSDVQLDWLEHELATRARKDSWVFVFMHHPVYSTGDTGSLHIYELAYLDMFNEYQVDAVFYGHDHLFEVYWTGRDTQWGGTHYCLVGNGAEANLDMRDPYHVPPSPYLWKGRTYVPERDGILGGNAAGPRNDAVVRSSYEYGILEPGFAHVHVDGDACELRAWGLENQVYFKDSFGRTGHGKRYHPPDFIQAF